MELPTLRQAHRWLDVILGFVFPEVCQICESKRATFREGYVCGTCRAGPEGVRWIAPPLCGRCGLPYSGEITDPFRCGNCWEIEFHFNQARAAVVASPLILDVIHRYKYRRQRWFEPFLSGLLLEAAVPLLHRRDWDFIVPVPLHPVKQREREFNQAERLGAHLSRATGIPLKRGVVKRVVATQTQTRLTREERAVNVEGAFDPVPSHPLHGGRIVLVDDVLTTGATTNACAKALRQNGAREICVWTVARGLQTR